MAGAKSSFVEVWEEAERMGWKEGFKEGFEQEFVTSYAEAFAEAWKRTSALGFPEAEMEEGALENREG